MDKQKVATRNPVPKTTPDATIRKEVYLTLDLQEVVEDIGGGL